MSRSGGHCAFMHVPRMLQVDAIPIGSTVHTATGATASAPTFCERLQRLDPDAWQCLYCDHRRLMRGILAGHLGYRAELDDAVQQVFETAMLLVSRNRARLSGDPSGVRAWLAAIAVRIARTEARRVGKARLVDSVRDRDLVCPPSVEPEGYQLLEHALSILARLPERHRVPWWLRHIEHLTLEETATALGVSLATVKRRLQAADRRFQELAHRDHVLCEHLTQGGNHD